MAKPLLGTISFCNGNASHFWRFRVGREARLGNACSLKILRLPLI